MEARDGHALGQHRDSHGAGPPLTQCRQQAELLHFVARDNDWFSLPKNLLLQRIGRVRGYGLHELRAEPRMVDQFESSRGGVGQVDSSALETRQRECRI
jgi:hypothetical protein